MLFSVYITVAPELLDGVQIGWNFPKGTVVGDIYSFGIMLYSIIFRIRPFDRLSLKGCNNKLKEFIHLEEFKNRKNCTKKKKEECYHCSRIKLISEVLSNVVQKSLRPHIESNSGDPVSFK